MKFKFKVQPYQTQAVESIVRVFKGQPFNDRVSYLRDIGTSNIERTLLNADKSDIELLTGFANAPIALDSTQILENIKDIQIENNLRESASLSKDMGACSLDIEMETGTGKTYVYIKSMFELNKRYGWGKFIVVVPSIAIREGVRKSFEMMQEHFMEHYGKKARFFVYNSKNLNDIDTFSSSGDLSVMIINIQAFNARGSDARRISMELDEFGSRKPIDIIQANRPIIIMDEPQKMGGAATKDSLKAFAPLFTLHFSATHKEHHNLIYVLDALDAYKMKLVKKIEVKGFDIKNLRGTDKYLFLEKILISPNKPPQARLEFEIEYSSGIKREMRIVKVDDDLYALSKMEQYKGYHISEIDPLRNIISFTNGISIEAGEVQGDVSQENIRQVQIRETIRSHFEKEKELFDKGIKTLSLFFIDKVEHYRKYDEEGNEINSKYGEMFEKEYVEILNEYLSLLDTPYTQYLRSISPQETHTGYFSIDKKGRKIDSSLKRGTDISDDESAYDLILKDKERLLSFDTPVRFIFSHSALREGWDNPNVFQICTLKPGGQSSTNKRQEVGRGLRICVNQLGNRMDEENLGEAVQEINKLTVIASDGYKDFVSSLQKEIIADLYTRPSKATPEYFEGRRISVNDKSVLITKDQALSIYSYLAKNDYIDDDGRIMDKYHADAKNKTLASLPEKIKDMSEGVHKLIQGIFDECAFKDMIDNGNKAEVEENKLNENFYKKEFKTLWNHINHKYAYSVEFDSQELIQKATAHIDDKMFVAKLQYTLTKGIQGENLSADKMQSGEGFITESINTYSLERSQNSQVKYDLIGKIAKGTNLTRKSVATILKGISEQKFAMFKHNPEEFITKAIKLINEQKATAIVDGITYNKTSGVYDSTIFTAQKNKDFSKAIEAKKNVQKYIFTDSKIEKDLAQSMDLDEKVIVYAKLPRDFKIPTPVGNYAPDWAICFQKGSVKHIFFIAETKGTMASLDLRPIEKAKIQCAKKLFKKLLSAEDIVYHDVDTYENLLSVIEAI